ncbi:hypothetical protein CDIK_4527, partial [Cucumispora dikerogammari]
MLQSYFTERKNKKWTNKLAIYFVILMFHKTYVLYKTFSKEENKINTHLDFRTACIRYLLEKSDEGTILNIQRKKLKIENTAIHLNSRLVKKHFPNKIQNRKYK